MNLTAKNRLVYTLFGILMIIAGCFLAYLGGAYSYIGAVLFIVGLLIVIITQFIYSGVN